MVSSKEKESVSSDQGLSSSLEVSSDLSSEKGSSGSSSVVISPDAGIQVLSLDSENEKIALSYSGTKLTKAYYQCGAEAEVEIDSNLITDDTIYVPGLKEGTYQLRLVLEDNKEETISSIAVSAVDRSGYAHFSLGSTTTYGAYNLDGTLRSDAVVVYVSDSNKNTVTATIGSHSYTGLVDILNHKNDASIPVDVRLLDRIKTNQWKSKSLSSGINEPYLDDISYFYNEKETTYTELDGLTNTIWAPSTIDSKKATASGITNVRTVTSSKDTDSYFNMADVKNVSNLTVEGIGIDAGTLNWGFTFKDCKSIEARNLIFEDYAEDACSFEGSDNNDVTKADGFFLHHNTFKRGKNNWDLSQEQDKHDGDGSADLKKCQNVTFAYNYFYDTHKTGLIGGSDSHYTKNVTSHHNFYELVNARLPLGRRVNLHTYNNYYLNCTTCTDMRASSYTLSEANYFEKCTYPHKVSSNAVIKSYQDTFDQCKKTSQATIVTSRTQ